MNIERLIITSRDGLQINACAWLPENAKAIICIVHGIGEHLGRYNELAEYFYSNGFAVFAYDQRGHGKSEGKRGYSPSYTLLLDDVENVMKLARSLYSDIPLFLYGHSWGGNIVANFIIKRKTKELSGAILSAPWFELKLNLSPVLLAFAKIIHRIIPSLSKHNGLLPEYLSKDPEEVKSYIDDPLVHTKITVSTYMQAYIQGKWAIENAHTLKVPTLIMHGSNDSITSMEASKIFASNGGTFVTLKLWEGVKHEPHHDWEKKDVFDYVNNWLHQNMPISHYD